MSGRFYTQTLSARYDNNEVLNGTSTIRGLGFEPRYVECVFQAYANTITPTNLVLTCNFLPGVVLSACILSSAHPIKSKHMINGVDLRNVPMEYTILTINADDSTSVYTSVGQTGVIIQLTFYE